MTDDLAEVTLEEYERLPDDGYRHELSQGILVREPQPGVRHNHIAANVFRHLDAFVRSQGLGVVGFGTGYVLRESPRTLRGPDVSFIASHRLPIELPIGYWRFAPDLAVEILSPSNSASGIEKKVLEYLDAGTQMVWVIDPETRSARSYRGNEATLIRFDGVLSAADVIPGFVLSLSDVLELSDTVQM